MSEMGYSCTLVKETQGEQLQRVDEVAAMLRLAKLGWGAKRIGRELGVSRNTVKRYLRQGGWAPYANGQRGRALAGLEVWLKERFHRHRGNADVIRQELLAEHGVKVSLRTVERAVVPLRQALLAEAKATVRYETAPGEQMQIDFGTTSVVIGGEQVRVRLFVATLGYSRRLYVEAFEHERQSAWLSGLEGAFRHFGGVTAEVLVDNAKALVSKHDRQTRKVEFNERFLAFSAYWGFVPRACAPYRARTKGKDESGVRYVKRNAIAGRMFDSWEALAAHLLWWMREVADQRIHGTTFEPPAVRFEQERAQLKPVDGKVPFAPVRALKRQVNNESCVEVDTNHYSVPWRLLRQEVIVEVENGSVRVLHGGQIVACHVECLERHKSVIERSHLEGIVGAGRREAEVVPPPALLRSLDIYEQAVGGGF